MEAIRKIQTVKDGQLNISLPEQFWGQEVEIIILASPKQNQRTSQKKSLRGCLRDYAEPKLRAREKEAWQDAVRDKHGHY